MPTPAVPTRSLEFSSSNGTLRVLDQTRLPHEVIALTLSTLDDVCDAIRRMVVRGAPLIGACAAFGMAFALRDDASPEAEARAANALLATRPTAVNLTWSVERVRRVLAAEAVRPGRRAARALAEAQAIAAEDAAACSAIGDHGLEILRALQTPDARRPLRALTHCNAGWLATCAWGTALAPIYKAHAARLPIHVWVDETRPRSQGALLTAWELGIAGVPHTLIADTAAAHVLQRGLADIVLVGSDRTTAAGDVCNKIGTYAIALAAREAGVPFYAALPTSSIDWTIEDGLAAIAIEERAVDEVLEVRGLAVGEGAGSAAGEGAGAGTDRVRIAPKTTPVFNPAFDVTPAKLVTGLVTEHGVFRATREDLARLHAIVEAAAAAAAALAEDTPRGG
jgi:methylthioribose-1-phosphate isomerase